MVEHSGRMVKLFSQEKVYDNLSCASESAFAAFAIICRVPLSLLSRRLWWQGCDSDPRLQVLMRVRQPNLPTKLRRASQRSDSNVKEPAQPFGLTAGWLGSHGGYYCVCPVEGQMKSATDACF
jgi:hypothetical protein